MAAQTTEHRKPFRWHIIVFLAPAVLVYSLVMILPLFGTLQLSLFRIVDRQAIFVGLDNFRTLFGDPRWSVNFWNALANNFWFFVIHMLVQNPIGVLLAALLSSPHAAVPRLLPHGDLRADHPVLRHRRLRLEADPVAAVGRRPVSARSRRLAEPVRAVARQRALCAVRARA